jgi:hypothetical protein
MKNIFLIILAAIFLTTYCYTENQIKISINKNNRGEILLNITGHTSPVIVEMNGKSITFNVGDNETNLDEAIDVKVDDMDTASGVEQSSIDSQIPPVSNSINPNPPLATPY